MGRVSPLSVSIRSVLRGRVSHRTDPPSSYAVVLGSVGCAVGPLDGDLRFQNVEKLAQHFCGFQIGLAYRIAESGVQVPEVVKWYAKDGLKMWLQSG